MKTSKPIENSVHGHSPLQRPRFGPGLLLEDEDLTAGIDYTRNMMMMMLQSLFGCGVVCGLKVTADWACNQSQLKVQVARGVALDSVGHPIVVPKAESLTLDPKCDPMPCTVWVTVCYAQKCCRPKDVSCSTDDDSRTVYTRAQDAYTIKVSDQFPDCACTCEKKPTEPGRRVGCCDDDQSATGGAPGTSAPGTTLPTAGGSQADQESKDEPCPCYSDHFNGICACDCDCGCNCVVIARIDLCDKDAKALETPVIVTDDVVREIRPVLNGYMKCKYPEDDALGA